MANVNRYTFTDKNDKYTAEYSPDIHKSFKNEESEPYGFINLDEASKKELMAYRQGFVDRIIYVEKDFQNASDQEINNNQNYNNIKDMQTAFGNQNEPLVPEGNGMGNGHQIEKPKVKTLVPKGFRSPYQSQPSFEQPLDNQFPGSMAAFSDRLLIALLGSFGLGVIMATVYIFINLGKVTITL